MSVNLTERQMDIAKFIFAYRKKRGIAPTLGEIGDAIGASKITVFEHVGLMEKKGAITRQAYRSRGLSLSRSVVHEIESLAPDGCCPTCGRKIQEST